jgi:hypothetical protein
MRLLVLVDIALVLSGRHCMGELSENQFILDLASGGRNLSSGQWQNWIVSMHFIGKSLGRS